ncbi:MULTISPECIES: isochorismatase family protein [Streptomyces]|uniref:Isochorismatase family protein n=1 Tax=Streptomyces edwardsiae TaxID=3075527 RepID=A0ABU2QCD4_9ACTN|nr:MULTISPECIES: isochorismatase family protein [unclassified Streptomyces]MDT0401598.1 isochorismatase family protein [Streptomyces sp. DSM 41635]
MTQAAVPEIVPHAMPTAAELPRNTAGWVLDPDRAVLLIHDMQRFFVEKLPAFRSPRTELVRHTVALREAAVHAGVPVLYTAQPGGMSPDERGLLADFWGPGMSTDPEDRAVVDELVPDEGDTVLTKWRASAYHGGELLRLLRASGRDQMVLCGIYAHVGVLLTASDGFAHGVQTFVAGDATADFSRGHHRLALSYMAARCAMVLPTGGLVAALDGSRVADAEPAGARS